MDTDLVAEMDDNSMSEPLASRKLHPYVPSGVWRWFGMLMESFEVSRQKCSRVPSMMGVGGKVSVSNSAG